MKGEGKEEEGKVLQGQIFNKAERTLAFKNENRRTGVTQRRPERDVYPKRIVLKRRLCGVVMWGG